MSRRASGTGRCRAAAVVLAMLTASAGALGGQADQRWRSASPDRRLAFPADHASHPDYKIEWWYYTGNLDARDGRRFGYQLTFFRVGVQIEPSGPSRWAVRDLHMAHLAVTDIDGGAFRFAERLDRGVLGLAGADVDRYHVWNGTWSVARGADGRHRLSAAREGLGIELTLDETTAPVVHGIAGFSQKGSGQGNATHYYSLPRMATRGTITLDGKPIEVTGTSWMDHEFGTSFLEAGQRGWDWFSLQLDDESELMLFQLRRDDGSRDPHSAGTLVTRDGSQRGLGGADFVLSPGTRWSSDVSGGDYPIEWDIQIPSQEIELNVKALVAGQELATPDSTGVTYWEGAVEVEGTRNGRPVTGRGYLEMTGYAGRPMSAVLR